MTPEQTEKLQHYLTILTKWQNTINLIGKSTIDEAWERHFLDSAQLEPLIPQNAKIMDIGSGAGFPGLVLAAMRPDISVTLVESDGRKCAFLSSVSRETSTKVKIMPKRIEDVSRETSIDIITARALASVVKLLDYCWDFTQNNPDITLLLMKGEKYEEEIIEAQKHYRFSIETIQSATHPDAKILKIKNVSRETSKTE